MIKKFSPGRFPEKTVLFFGHSNSIDNDNDNTNNNHNKSQLLGARRKGDQKHGLKLSKPILNPIPPTTLLRFESSQKAFR